MHISKSDKTGGTSHILGHVSYSGSRDELEAKLRARDDEIDGKEYKEVGT